jgi:hypothetical protein
MDFTGHDAAAMLAHADELVLRHRRMELEDLQLLVHWADLHASDPQAEARARGERIPPFADRLMQVGGEGTPGLQEFSIAELAVSRRVHPSACRNQLADALDLRFRLPKVWRRVAALGSERWLACKIARMTRDLSPTQVALVDIAVAEVIGSLSPGRLLSLAEAKIIEVAADDHAQRCEVEQRRRYVALGRKSAYGLRLLIARIKAADAVWVDGMVERVADLLEPRFPAGTARDVLRSEAFGWLARPAELLTLLTESGNPIDLDESRTTAVSPDLMERLRTVDPTRLRTPAVVYVHLHQAAVGGACPGVARMEGVGPVLLEQLAGLLGNAQVKVTPVVDLADRVSVDAYETPEAVKERIRLTTVGDYFPYAVSTARDVDFDHPTPYVHGGASQQTGTHNSGPLTRAHHRVKTHAYGWKARQLGPGEYVWRTPHHRYRLIDGRGTHWLPEDIGEGLFSDDPLDRGLTEFVVNRRRAPLGKAVPSPA